MTLKEQLMADFKEAMKAKDEVAKNTISFARAAVKQYEVDTREELDDAGIVAILSKQVKMRRDALADFEKAGRTDLVESYNAEIEILTRYLPEQLSEEKLREIVAETAAEYQTEVEVVYSSSAPAVINPEGLTKQVQALLPNVLTDMEPTRIAEDFSRYQEKAPGVLLWLGVGDTPSLHNGKFLVPKEVLPLGVDAWVRLAEHKW